MFCFFLDSLVTVDWFPVFYLFVLFVFYLLTYSSLLSMVLCMIFFMGIFIIFFIGCTVYFNHRVLFIDGCTVSIVISVFHFQFIL